MLWSSNTIPGSVMPEMHEEQGSPLVEPWLMKTRHTTICINPRQQIDHPRWVEGRDLVVLRVGQDAEEVLDILS